MLNKNPDKKNIVTELSGSITNKYNGFNIVRLEQSKTIMQIYTAIENMYKPFKNCNKVINCYFSKKINLAFRSAFSENGILKHGTAFQCHFCSNYYGRKDKYDRHLDSCTGKPGYIYNFNTQSLITFEENLKYNCDIPLTAYIDFETTAFTDDCLVPENAKMFVVSYVIIFTFHSEQDIDKVITERSFGYSEYNLTSLNYLTVDQLNFKNNKTLLQLRDCALNVAPNKSKFAIAEMLTTELKFGGDCLLKCFNKKYKYKNLKLSNEKKKI